MAPKDKLNFGKKSVIVGTFVMEFSVPQIATILARAGADFIVIDQEHTTFTMETVGNIVRSARASGITAIVRIPEVERHFVSRSLDAGADALMVPRVESGTMLDRVAKWSKYPPMGDRGVAFGIGHDNYGDFRKLDGVAYTHQANEKIAIIGQIETAKGIENLDEIFDNANLDFVFIGLYDLSTSLGIPGQLDHPVIVKNVKKVFYKAKQKGIPIGSYVNDFESGKEWVELGAKMIAIGNDAFLLTCKFSEESNKFRSLKVKF